MKVINLERIKQVINEPGNHAAVMELLTTMIVSPPVPVHPQVKFQSKTLKMIESK